METGESEADRQALGFAGTCLLAILAIFGGLFLAGGIREVARQNTSAGVFSAQVLVAQRAPEYEVAFTGPDGFVRVDINGGIRYRYRVGSRLDVRYWPAEHRVERATNAARYVIVFGALMVLIGAPAAGYRIIRARRRRTPSS
jgi:hypothetical protein